MNTEISQMDFERFRKLVGPALAAAQHRDTIDSWPWYGRLIHRLFVRRCPACKLWKENHSL